MAARSRVTSSFRRSDPDLLDPAFDRGEAHTRVRACADEAVADVLLNQRVIAGIGNVFKSEILFMARVDPFARVAVLSDEAIDRVLDVAVKGYCGRTSPDSATRWRRRADGEPRGACIRTKASGYTDAADSLAENVVRRFSPGRPARMHGSRTGAHSARPAIRRDPALG